MNCTQTQQHLDDYFDDLLSLQDSQAVDQHLATCNVCNRCSETLVKVRQALKKMAIVECHKGFEDRLLRVVRRHYAEPRRNHYWLGFSTAMAMTAALWFVGSLFFQQAPLLQPQTVMVSLYDARQVSLSFSAANAIDKATLSIGLPENVELSGYPGRRELSWQIELKQGQNVLTLPIRAIGQGKGELVAQLHYGNKSKTFKLVLQTVAGDALNNSVVIQAVDSV